MHHKKNIHSQDTAEKDQRQRPQGVKKAPRGVPSQDKNGQNQKKNQKKYHGYVEKYKYGPQFHVKFSDTANRPYQDRIKGLSTSTEYSAGIQNGRI
jgi:hypothetical protein